MDQRLLMASPTLLVSIFLGIELLTGKDFHLIQEFSLVYFINYPFILHLNHNALYIQPQDVEFTCSAVNVK